MSRLIARNRDFTPGSRADTFTAADWLAILGRLERRAYPRVVPPLTSPERGVIDLQIPEGTWATLSGSGSPYSWAEVQGVSGGTWGARVSSGTANAYEANAVGGLAGKTVWLEPGWPGDYRFQMVAAGAGSDGDTATISGCACTAIPTTLHLSSSGPCGAGVFPSCTFVYGPTPAEFSGQDLGSNCFLSAETFIDSYSGASYRFHLGCDTIYFRLSRVYEPSDSGDAFHDATIYAWSIGAHLSVSGSVSGTPHTGDTSVALGSGLTRAVPAGWTAIVGGNAGITVTADAAIGATTVAVTALPSATYSAGTSYTFNGPPLNTCDPFLLSSGIIYSGGDPACVVVVTE